MIKKDIINKFYDKSLIKISDQESIDRYNECLKFLQLEPSRLTSFSIDAMGWSPEIAEEFRNEFYLTHGAANPYAIIISPDQEFAPVLFPVHSYDYYLILKVFENFRFQIADITLEVGICIDIDQEITTYNEPEDLLMVEDVMLRFSTPKGIMQKAIKQRDLVKEFHDDSFSWMNESLYDELIDSVEMNGDMRFRSLIMHDLPYTDVRSFYTRAFGGVFIFRDIPSEKSIVIQVMKDEIAQNNLQLNAENYQSFFVNDQKLVLRLIEEQIVTIEADFWNQNLSTLDDLMITLIINQWFDQYENELEAYELHEFKHIIRVMDKQGVLPEEFKTLEAFRNKLKNRQFIDKKSMTKAATRLLLHPPMEQSIEQQDLTWKLLSFINQIDFLNLFKNNKELFFKKYESWSVPKKKWIINYIQRRLK